ncbi:hypothetical protein JTB14_016616 [Gonioctena quinquepunctata]|nr:hypothetical protein JTB14_016616 [Gonioctena quinquepunctata]
MMSYTRFVFEETGSTISPIASTISCSVTEVIVVICTTYFIIDRFGKKLLAIISLGGCSVTLFVMGMYFYLKDYHDNVIDHLNWLPVTTLVSYYVVFSIGISFVPICYLSELFPTNVKANALSFAEVFLVSTGAATIKVFQMMNDGFGTLWVTFFFFSLLSVCSLCLVVKFVPETRGQTLEEIQLYLKGSTEGKKQKYREGVI